VARGQGQLNCLDQPTTNGQPIVLDQLAGARWNITFITAC